MAKKQSEYNNMSKKELIGRLRKSNLELSGLKKRIDFNNNYEGNNFFWKFKQKEEAIQNKILKINKAINWKTLGMKKEIRPIINNSQLSS